MLRHRILRWLFCKKDSAAYPEMPRILKCSDFPGPCREEDHRRYEAGDFDALFVISGQGHVYAQVCSNKVTAAKERRDIPHDWHWCGCRP